jgi:hypothetical protein
VLPGPVEDEEIVSVRSDLDGDPLSVKVKQWLRLHGIGDFFFRIPGPALRVEPLPVSQSPPGIRKGSILWQGFSPDGKVLAAEATLDPERELERLPLRVAVSVEVDGRPLLPNESRSGDLRARIEVSNVTSIPINLASGEVARQPLAAALDAIATKLRDRERPVPGSDGVPRAVVSRVPVELALDEIQTAFDFGADVLWTPGTVKDLRSDVGRVRGAVVDARGTVGGGGESSFVITIRGTAVNAELPDVHVVATPAPPPPSTVAPPGASSWKDVPESKVSNAEMFTLLMRTMWRTALLVNYDAYLGNPDARGESVSTYVYDLRNTVEDVGPAPTPEVVQADMLLLVLALVALSLLVLATTTAWSLA